MRTHGEPDYPEPGRNSEAQVNAFEKLDPNSPRFQTAAKACRQYLPMEAPACSGETAKVRAEALKFAHCMQTHGMSNWPDPSSRGGYLVAPAGAAVQSTVYLKAAKICRPLLSSG
ncbi:MAG: hypothetical protein JWO62_2384 [Acidimicrobiaceae bacterium]|jgi:hypothetical protein|nr:hypothetical protein [Acidimicrobiaceae bacterium]